MTSSRSGHGDDSYNGGAGADRAYGGPGNDQLSGDEGVDSLYGGRGDDEVRGAYHCYSNSERFPCPTAVRTSCSAAPATTS